MLSNLPLKVASLVLASLLWFVIAGEKTAEIGLEIPVEFRNVPQELSLVGDPANRVEVRLRASPGLLQSLTPGDVHALLDLSGVRAGERILHLAPESIQVPFGVDVVNVVPSMLTLHFEPLMERLVPVKPRIEGEPAPGFESGSVDVQPPVLRIAGPESRVAAVDAVTTEPISVAGATAPISAAAGAGLEDAQLRILGERRVRVTVEVRERHGERQLQGLSIEVRGGAGSVRPALVDVSLRGPEALLEQLTAESIRPFVDTAQPGQDGMLEVAVELMGPFHVLEVVATEPNRVALRPGRRK
jgi:YbbR-like protein